MMTILRPLFLVCALILASLMHGQTDIAAVQQEIDRTVWKPFKHAFESLNADALNATYADQVLRVTPGGIDTRGDFKSANVERFTQNKDKGIRIDLDFWFDSRHTNSTTSYEVGFYRILSTDSIGQSSAHYGQFHIVLKHIDGHWKITQDWDTAKIGGEPIGEKHFARREPRSF